MPKHILPFSIGIIVILTIALFVFGKLSRNTTDSQNISPTNTQSNKQTQKVSVLAGNLQIPWALDFLPTGEILFTQRTGEVRIIDKDGSLKPSPLLKIGEVKTGGEGGLMGIAVSPNFQNNKKVFLYYTYEQSGPLNKVVSYTLDGENLIDPKVLIENIKGAQNHNGGRIKFGPDRFLYITTGDAQNPSLAQDTKSTSGKILRTTEDGRPAPGNPFGNLVYSYGHRNPQGLAWDSQNRMLATEHGPSARDEINRIEQGKNYGWPDITANQTKQNMVTPFANSNSDTWAPSGATILDDYLYFAGLRGQALYRMKITDSNPKVEEFFKNEFGRLRDVIVGPDNLLYVTTNNTDGRGSPSPDDDKILIINPQLL